MSHLILYLYSGDYACRSYTGITNSGEHVTEPTTDACHALCITGKARATLRRPGPAGECRNEHMEV